jgi:hypothetical protein
MINASLISSRFALLLAPFLLLSCITASKEEPHGTEVENEVVGYLYLADGRPAAQATVKLYPVDYIAPRGAPKTGRIEDAGYVTVTDANGKYVVDSLANGEYNILGKLGSSRSFQDSVAISSSSGTLPPDTLSGPGSLTGYVALQPNHDLRSVAVQLLGTDVNVNVDSSGKFRLESLAAGNYRARVATTYPEYSPLFVNLHVRENASDTLEDTLRPVFTGIPVVTGLKAFYDTLHAAALVSWHPAVYGKLQYYAVFRDQKGAVELTKVPVTVVEDTSFSDTLYRFGRPIGALTGDTAWRQWEYRIRVVNTSDEMGLAFGKVTVLAVPPSQSSTTLRLKLKGFLENQASIGDSVRIIAEFHNPTRKMREIRWYVNKSPDPLSLRSLDSTDGVDTLAFLTPPFGATLRFYAKVRDEAGVVWSDSVSTEVLWDDPMASAGNDTTVSINDTVRLSGTASDRFGRIVKWEWDVGNTGRFSESSSRDTFFVAPSHSGNIPVMLQVTDDDGRRKQDLKYVRVVSEDPVANAGKDTAIGYLDSLRLHGSGRVRFGSIVKWEWDIGNTGVFRSTSGPDTTASPHGVPNRRFRSVLRVTDEDGLTGTDTVDFTLKPSRFRADMPTGRANAGMVSVAGKLYVFGGLSGSGSNMYSSISRAVEVYDPVTDQWTTKKPMEETWWNFAICAYAGKIYLAGGEKNYGLTTQVSEYDPVTDTWKDLTPLPDTRYAFAMVGLDGRLWAIGGQGSQKYTAYIPGMTEDVEALDLGNNVWNRRATLPKTRPGLAAAVVNGKIIITGGVSRDDNNKAELDVDEYDPSQDSWKLISTSPSHRHYHSMVTIAGKIYLVGGEILFPRGATPPVEEFDPVSLTWTVKQNFTTNFNSAAYTEAGGKIYSVGGVPTEYSPLYERSVEEYTLEEE